MKTLFALALAAGATMVAIPSADARDGCGRGAHRGPAGHCRANVGYGHGYGYGRPGVTTRLVIGNFYGGRGYWDGRRYYQNRYRYHNGWRYR